MTEGGKIIVEIKTLDDFFKTADAYDIDAIGYTETSLLVWTKEPDFLELREKGITSAMDAMELVWIHIDGFSRITLFFVAQGALFVHYIKFGESEESSIIFPSGFPIKISLKEAFASLPAEKRGKYRETLLRKNVLPSDSITRDFIKEHYLKLEKEVEQRVRKMISREGFVPYLGIPEVT